MLIYRCNSGALPPPTIVSLAWEDFTDALKFFTIFPTEEELLKDPLEGMSTSKLVVRRNFRQHQHSVVVHAIVVVTNSATIPGILEQLERLKNHCSN